MRSHITPAACQGLLGRLFGHRYEGRYSEHEAVPDGVSFQVPPGPAGERLVEATKTRTRTYHGDVCVRCGDVVNAPEAP